MVILKVSYRLLYSILIWIYCSVQLCFSQDKSVIDTSFFNIKKHCVLIEGQLLNKQSLAFGFGIYSIDYGHPSLARGILMTNDFNIKKTKGDYSYLNKLSIFVDGGLHLGLSLNNYTDFNNYRLAIAPEIGLGFGPTALYYSYNLNLINTGLHEPNRHNLTYRLLFKLYKD